MGTRVYILRLSLTAGPRHSVRILQQSILGLPLQMNLKELAPISLRTAPSSKSYKHVLSYSLTYNDQHDRLPKAQIPPCPSQLPPIQPPPQIDELPLSYPRSRACRQLLFRFLQIALDFVYPILARSAVGKASQGLLWSSRRIERQGVCIAIDPLRQSLRPQYQHDKVLLQTSSVEQS